MCTYHKLSFNRVQDYGVVESVLSHHQAVRRPSLALVSRPSYLINNRVIPAFRDRTANQHKVPSHFTRCTVSFATRDLYRFTYSYRVFLRREG